MVAPAYVGICQRMKSQLPVWSPDHCTPQRCAPAQLSGAQVRPRASLLSSMPL